MYLGDFVAGATIDFKWNTISYASGSVTRSTDGSIRIYKANSVTQRSSASGITDTEDFDSLTGLHHCRIDLSDDTDTGFYAAGSDYQVVIQGMVVDGATVNAVIAEFSIENRNDKADVREWIGTAVATPTTAGVPEVDLTHINGAAQTATLDTIKAETASILTDTAEIGVAGAGLTNINLPDQTMNITGDITGSLSGSVGSVTGAVGSVTGNVGGNVTGSVGSLGAQAKLDVNAEADTAIAGAALATAANLATVDTIVDAIKAKTDSLTFTVAGVLDSNIQYVNDVQVTGTGASGDEWGP